MIEGIWPLLQQHHSCKPVRHKHKKKKHISEKKTYVVFPGATCQASKVSQFLYGRRVISAPPRHTAGARQCVARAASPHHTSVHEPDMSILGKEE